MKKQEKLCVLITGAAAGIGNAVAKRFMENGHTVYALDLRLPQVGTPLQGDITDETAMQEIFSTLQKDGVRFDGIFHFAGIHMMGSFIETEYAKIKRLNEIDFLGAVLVNKTFYPLLKPQGRIYITSSEVAPLAPLPFNGIYSVAKTAVDAYAQALRQELNLLGQKVITIRPGAVKTELADGSAVSTARLCEETQLYRKQSRNFCGIVKKFTGTPMPVDAFAAFVYKIAMKKRPKPVYAKHRHLGLTLLGVLPVRLQCFIVKKLVNK
jgi:NAD(P)-dependent dehydrogenase (short-subunit alcohol dehydrogenase family)